MAWVNRIQTLLARTREEGTRRIVHGLHVFGNLKSCDVELLKSEEELRKIACEAARVGNMTIVSVISHKFGIEGGVSVIVIVAESHISIHTWPEYAYATVDVYTCGAKSNPLLAFIHIARRLRAREVEMFISDRSLYTSEENLEA